MKPQIIAICGLKRSGKDTIAKYITNKYGYHHMKIAKPLKDTVCNLFNINSENLENESKDMIDPTWKTSPRTIMDFIGTHVFQYELQKIIPHIHRNFWINILLNNVKDRHVVISDLRFKHEYEEIIKHYNCKVIKVLRHTTSSDMLPSEIEYDDIPNDVVLHNNHTIQDLHDTLSKVLINDFQMSNNNKDLDVYTDGSCIGNPGIGGWGVYIPSLQEEYYDGSKFQNTTNNIMELNAIKKALEFTEKYREDFNKIIIHTDSTYVKNGLNNWIKKWKQNNWKTLQNKDVKNKQMWMEIDTIMVDNPNKYEIRWIKAHNGHIHNEYVDQLAKRFLNT